MAFAQYKENLLNEFETEIKGDGMKFPQQTGR